MDSKITLNYDGPHFTADIFCIENLCGADAVIFTIPMQTDKKRSVEYYVFNKDKTPAAVCIHDLSCSTNRLPGESYILVSKGATGFDFDRKLFTAAVKKKGSAFTVTITELTDAALREELWETASRSAWTCEDEFSKALLEKTEPLYHKSKDYDRSVTDTLQIIKDTPFLDVDPSDESYVYLKLYQHENGFSHRNIYTACCKNRIEAGNILSQRPDGLFTEFKYTGQKPGDIGTMLIKESDNVYIIAKPDRLYHDIHAALWLGLTVQYRCPQDAAKIAEAYPQVYSQATKLPEFWRKYQLMDKEPAPYNFGDKQMLIPCTHIKGMDDLICMKKEPFHFACREEGAALSGLGADNDLLAAEKYALRFIKHGGAEYLAVYENKGKARWKKDIYAMYEFYKLIPLKDVLAADVFSGEDELLEILCWSYVYQKARYGIEPAPVSDDIFDALDTMQDADD